MLRNEMHENARRFPNAVPRKLEANQQRRLFRKQMFQVAVKIFGKLRGRRRMPLPARTAALAPALLFASMSHVHEKSSKHTGKRLAPTPDTTGLA